MNYIEFFKQQADFLVKDYKTQYYDESEGYQYKPRFFKYLELMIWGCDIDETQPLKLSVAQHAIAKLAGFRKWNDLIGATKPELELGKLLFNDIQPHGISEDKPSVVVADWLMYLKLYKLENMSGKEKLELFKEWRKGDEPPVTRYCAKNMLNEIFETTKVSPVEVMVNLLEKVQEREILPHILERVFQLPEDTSRVPLSKPKELSREEIRLKVVELIAYSEWDAKTALAELVVWLNVEGMLTEVGKEIMAWLEKQSQEKENRQARKRAS